MKTVGRARKADRTQTPSTTTWACRMVHRYLACRGNTTATTLPTQTQYTLSGTWPARKTPPPPPCQHKHSTHCQVLGLQGKHHRHHPANTNTVHIVRYLACRENTKATTLPTQTQYTLSGATDASSSLNDINTYFWRPNKDVPKELTKCTEGDGVTSYCGTFCVCVCVCVCV